MRNSQAFAPGLAGLTLKFGLRERFKEFWRALFFSADCLVRSALLERSPPASWLGVAPQQARRIGRDIACTTTPRKYVGRLHVARPGLVVLSCLAPFSHLWDGGLAYFLAIVHPSTQSSLNPLWTNDEALLRVRGAGSDRVNLDETRIMSQ